MKVALVYQETKQNMEIANLFNSLCCHDALFTRDDENPDVVITIGGDGTLLNALHRYENLLDTVRFASIHTGHLGFYTDWQEFEVEELITVLKNDQGERVSYPLLDVKVTEKDGTIYRHHALNESTLKKANGTLLCEVFINNQHFETFRGDGLCIATPTGSTGINKSLGGAVVHPSTEVMQLTEMASINNVLFRTLSSPIIFAKTDKLLLKPIADSGMTFSIDHLTYEANDVIEVECTMGDKRISFMPSRHTPFWQRVEQSFIGESQKSN
ncbi:NAD+ kinase [Granulicatella balaenopterae]|uniref:NAD kinase n=1 Tax=Granulicatella balaenopterae TaxID=137733 RepID=A0A1H9MMM3_9LACT|nr:NAD kinase [Granulicatella balaenopterae]SER24759.1 NAD+ kinase [Granulicatella balaenopterae]